MSFTQSDQAVLEVFENITKKWGTEAIKLKTFEGMEAFCHDRQHRVNTIRLIDDIHHYDSLLYDKVKVKYEQSGDEEALKTIQDIEKLESQYTTKSFIQLLHKECNTVVLIQSNYGNNKGNKYLKEVNTIEKELIKYIDEVTTQIDVINEYAYHF